MKRLDVPAATDDLDLYNITYVALLNSEARLTLAEMRTHSKILDKFEAVGKKQDNSADYRLPKGEGATVILEDAELALTKRLVESTAWNVRSSRMVVQLFDLLANAPEYLVQHQEARV